MLCKICNKEYKNLGVHVKKAHNINFLDPKNYDCILDTTNLTPKEILKDLLKQINKSKK